MADTSAPAPATTEKKKRKPQGPRVVKPIYAVVTYTGEDGAPIKLAKAGLSITLVRDAAAIVDMLESGTGDATIARVNLPEVAKRGAAPAA